MTSLTTHSPKITLELFQVSVASDSPRVVRIKTNNLSQKPPDPVFKLTDSQVHGEFNDVDADFRGCR